MEAETGGDEVEDELAEVRRLLDALVERRLTHPFSTQEQQEFDRLAERERVALRSLAGRPPSTETGTHEDRSQRC
jgi:hypothetical protein